MGNFIAKFRRMLQAAEEERQIQILLEEAREVCEQIKREQLGDQLDEPHEFNDDEAGASAGNSIDRNEIKRILVANPVVLAEVESYCKMGAKAAIEAVNSHLSHMEEEAEEENNIIINSSNINDNGQSTSQLSMPSCSYHNLQHNVSEMSMTSLQYEEFAHFLAEVASMVPSCAPSSVSLHSSASVETLKPESNMDLKKKALKKQKQQQQQQQQQQELKKQQRELKKQQQELKKQQQELKKLQELQLLERRPRK